MTREQGVPESTINWVPAIPKVVILTGPPMAEIEAVITITLRTIR